MKICCISASNIKHAGQNSTSLMVSNLIKKVIEQEYLEDLLVEKIEDSIVPIQEYDWKDIEERVRPLIKNVISKV